jgi:hypothetical protein
MTKKTSKGGFSYSWKRATGISGAKSSFSKKTGIPLSKSGRQRKFGQAAGCALLPTLLVILLAILFINI